ncbi:MAG: DUF4239 domain-containing protein [Ignavibacteria bacterium]|nr:DUF4239 domain-containing protein [Ignavibacteria bacterium]
MEFLLHWHPLLSVLFICVLTVSFAYIGLSLIRKNFSEDTLKDNHEVGGLIFNAFGLIYAVLLAFVVYITWTEYDNAKMNLETEATELLNLRFDSNAYPEEIKNKISELIRDYALNVVNKEWDSMNKGEVSDETTESFHRLWSVYTEINTSDIRNLQIYSESLKHLNHLGEKRRERIFSLKETIPPIIWAVLFFFAIISICYTFFFFTKRFWAQFIMTAGFTITNSFILYMIYVLDHPFTGYSRIEPDSFRYLLSLLN